MASVAWLYALFGAVTVTALAALLYGYGRVAAAAEPTADASASGADREAGGTVRCPHCDAENAAAFDFCRHCVAPLGSPARSGPG